jgi:hypothetical protein
VRCRDVGLKVGLQPSQLIFTFLEGSRLRAFFSPSVMRAQDFQE